MDVRFKPRLMRVLQDLRQGGYQVRVNSLYRTDAEQEELHRRWEAGDPDVITEPAPPGRSAHNFGMAADLNIAPAEYDVLGEVAADNGLTQPDPEDDPVHIELPNWRELIRGWTAEGRLVAV